MTGRARALVGFLALAAAFAAAASLVLSRAPLLDMTREPETVFSTIPFQVGDSYTLGSMAVPSDTVRPIRIRSIDVLEATGVELIGIGAFDPASASEAIGLVAGWPPTGWQLVDPTEGITSWTSDVEIVIGMRTTLSKSGLRGVVVRWLDGTGGEGQRVFDVAVITCAPGACEVDQSEPGQILTDLGLMR